MILFDVTLPSRNELEDNSQSSDRVLTHQEIIKIGENIFKDFKKSGKSWGI